MSRSDIEEEGGKVIDLVLKVSKVLKELDLTYSNIRAKVIGEGVKINSALTKLDLSDNAIEREDERLIGEVLKAIEETLRANKVLIHLNLRYNETGVKDGKLSGEVLKINTRLALLHFGEKVKV